MANRIIIFDTSVLIDHLRTDKYRNDFYSLNAIIRNSSVVLSELMRGATKKEEVAFVRQLLKNHPVFTPTEKNWIESGGILYEINKDKGFLPEKLRNLHFDILIALTARNYGATVITSDRVDFELISGYRNFNFEVW
ncbi:MAG: type II toxin-antitoxin system VapC family toxin [Nitrospinae bacterium]|nr:type II toxin-antitoxin system VapC family toxin [Nitrospinota bacterium]